MKTKHFFVFYMILFLFLACSFSARADTYWTKSYGGTAFEKARAVQPTSDGGFILVGWGDSFSPNGADPWVLKLDKDGQIEWQKAFTGSRSDKAFAVKQTTDGGYVIVGYTNSFSSNRKSNGLIIKLNGQGNVLWQKTYPGADYVHNYFYDVEIDPDNGNFVVVGTIDSGAGNVRGDLVVIKVSSSDGDIIWQKLYGKAPEGSYSSDPIDDEAYSIKRSFDGGYIIAGNTSVFGCGARWLHHFWILKLNGDGDLLWNQEISSTQSCDESIAYGVAQLSDGSFVAVGKVLTYDEDYVDVRGAYIVKLDQDGNLLWSKLLESGGFGAAYDVEATHDGGFIVTGATAYSTNAASYLWLTKFDAAGEMQWKKAYGNGSHSAWGYAVKPLSANAFVVAGLSPDADTNFWLLKVNGSGEIPDCPLAKDLDTAWRSTIHYATIVDEFRQWAHPVHTGSASLEAIDTHADVVEQCYAEGNQPPVIDSFTVEPSSGTAPLEVAVICEATDPDGNVVAYEFNPGDGSDPLTSEDGTFSYTYDTPGSYNATCTAYDNDEASVTSDPVTVTVTAPVTYYGLEVQVTPANGTGGIVTSNTEDISCPDNCSHNYEAGANVTITAEPAEGFTFTGWGGDCEECGNDTDCTITVDADKTCFAGFKEIPNEPPVIDSFTVEPSSGEAPLAVDVTCVATDPDGSIASYEFNPDDGSAPITSDNGTFSYTYSTPGSYNATCTAYDDDNASVTSEPVTVTVEEAGPSWNDITEGISYTSSRTLYDRIHRAFFVLLDVTNDTDADIAGPVRMVLESSSLDLKSGCPGLEPDGTTEDGKPYFIIVPEGETWGAGDTLEDLRLNFVLQRKRLTFELRFEEYGQ